MRSGHYWMDRSVTEDQMLGRNRVCLIVLFAIAKFFGGPCHLFNTNSKCLHVFEDTFVLPALLICIFSTVLVNAI